MPVGACRDAGRRRAMAGLVAAMAVAAGVAAADAVRTLREADLPGGEFSADYRSPTRIPPGVDRISGRGGVGSDDYLVFDLPAGAQTVRLEFRAPDEVGYSYSAGGVVLFDTAAFAYEWAGTQLPEPVRLDHRRRRQSMMITLPESFGGRLYLALNWTHGEDIAYAVSVPANVPVLIPTLFPARIPVEAPDQERAGVERTGTGPGPGTTGPA
jgi:hypothetical protein